MGTTTQWDAVVVGGGTAGLSAAQMLGRARRRTLVIDAGAPRNRFASHMHGVLGQDGTPPAELLAQGRAEVEAYGVQLRTGSVTSVVEHSSHLSITLEDGTVETTRALVVASGLTDDLPDIPGLAEHWGTGVLHCPYCHGWEVRGRRIGVLLMSPLQVHQAQLVRQWSDDVVAFTGAIGPLDEVMERRLRARGVEIVAEPVVEVLGDGEVVSGVRLEDGTVVDVGALFTMSRADPHDGFLTGLDLARTETPFGDLLVVDAMGKTSAPRIWAAGNVVNAAANVPVAMGTGAMAGAAANAALVEGDFDAAVRSAEPEVDPAEYWEGRYANRLWSGRANRTMTDIARGFPPGRSLDLGCGEGADTIWLAEHGWDATGLDISTTAVRRAQEAADSAGIRARFIAADLSEWEDAERYDLVTASFLHSPVAFDRVTTLRRAADRVAPGGRLLVVSHAAAPPWATANHVGDHVFLTAQEELAALAPAATQWTTVLVETRTRPATGPDGTESTLDDTVVLLQRRE